MNKQNSESKQILRIDNLKVHFPIRSGVARFQTGSIKAVDDISFEIFRGETLGLVGESGCGKTTTGRAIVGLEKTTDGSIFFEGKNLIELNIEQMRKYRRNLQMIFQDPYASLNPRMKILDIVGEPLRVHNLFKGKALVERVKYLLEVVGLNTNYLHRYPHEFSGGQRQRIGIARSLASGPSFIICDEPISALDVSIQAQIVNLLKKLQEEFDLTYLFIAHDLSMVRHISDRVAVMYLGQIMELASYDDLYKNPLHPYTVALLSAIPVADPEIEENRKQIILEGDVPSPANPPSGCPFCNRCPLAIEICHKERPNFLEVRPRHFSACHRVDESGTDTGLPPINKLSYSS